LAIAGGKTKMRDKKRGELARLLVKHRYYRVNNAGNPIGLSRKGAYILIFMVLSLGGSLGFLVWSSIDENLLSHPLRYLVSELAVIALLGIIAVLDYRLHPEGD
jgi:hypothetical protein